MATRTGLVSYGGDSEISDSEDEMRSSFSTTPPGIAVHGLGIPTSKPHTSPSPPSFLPQVISSAPSIGLVAYYEEEEGESHENREEVFKQPPTHQVDSSEHHQPDQEYSVDIPVVEITDEKESEDNPHPLFLPLSTVQLPPEPPGRCPQALQDKIVNLLKKKEQLKIDLNKNVQRRKDYRNPSIYSKLVQFCDLDEFGSNYPEHLFNPHEWEEESFYDNLLKAQKKSYEKKEKAKLERTKVEFVTGTKRLAAVSDLVTTQTSAKKPRKSKWDVSGEPGSRGNSPGAIGKPSGVGAQAIAQASQMNKELSKLSKW